MPGYDDEVDVRTGGLLLDYTGKVVDAFFGDGKFGTQLTVDVLLDHPEDYPHISDGIIHNWFGVGTGWVPAKNGAECVRAAADDIVVFNGNTLAGKLVKQMKEIDTDAHLLANGSTKTAAYWKGIGHARWGAINIEKRVQDETTGKWSNEPGGKDVSMPVELLGQAGTNGQAPAAFDLSALNLDPATLTALTDAASTADSFSKFLPAALGLGLDQSVFAVVSNPQTGPQVYAALKPF